MSDLLIAIFTGAGFFLTLLGFLFHLSYRLGKTEVKVDTMWEFQMRRAAAEVVTAKMGTMNSPLEISPEAAPVNEPLRSELQKMWATKWSKLKQTDVLLDIEKQFGARLLTTIGIPYKLTNGASLLIALAVAKGKPQLTVL